MTKRWRKLARLNEHRRESTPTTIKNMKQRWTSIRVCKMDENQSGFLPKSHHRVIELESLAAEAATCKWRYTTTRSQRNALHDHGRQWESINSYYNLLQSMRAIEIQWTFMESSSGILQSSECAIFIWLNPERSAATAAASEYVVAQTLPACLCMHVACPGVPQASYWVICAPVRQLNLFKSKATFEGTVSDFSHALYFS